MKAYFVWITLIIIPISILSQESEITRIEDTLDVTQDIFELSKPMVFTLTFDMKQYQKTKNKGEKMPAELQFLIGDSTIITKNIRIQARGAFRRQHCHLPPFWINIKKADVENENLQHTKKIKLVNHCKGAESYNNYVLKEYLTYKLYNILTPYSFRVGLVKMKYIDTGRKNKVTEGWAFMIEPEQMMAERLNSFPIKNDNISHTRTDSVSTDRVAVFQYMVGNGDYSIAGRHNVKLIKINEFQKPYPIPVPYDFDYSGLVNTYYALPGENLDLESVRERYFLGVCRSEEEYKSTLNYFKEKKEELIQLIADFEYLEEIEKADMINYLNEFYNEIDLQRFIERKFNSTCR